MNGFFSDPFFLLLCVCSPEVTEETNTFFSARTCSGMLTSGCFQPLSKQGKLAGSVHLSQSKRIRCIQLYQVYLTLATLRSEAPMCVAFTTA